MKLDEYIATTNKLIAHYEKYEDYEMCAYYRDLVKSINEKDEVAFVKLAFDLKGLKNSGFLKSLDPSDAIQRICVFFSFKSIFDYAEIDVPPHILSFTPDYWTK